MVYTFKAGLGAVGNYQVSGTPYITGSGADGLAAGDEHKIEFPSVAKSILVQLSDAGNDDVRVHFNSTGSAGRVVAGNHFFTLTNNRDSITFNTKCKEIYISNPGGNPSGYVIVAELTGIEPNEMFALTGSGLTD